MHTHTTYINTSNLSWQPLTSSSIHFAHCSSLFLTPIEKSNPFLYPLPPTASFSQHLLHTYTHTSRIYAQIPWQAPPLLIVAVQLLMAEEFSPYHVPQQSRREKLRVNTQQGCLRNLQDYQPVLPLYDPQLISPDFIGSPAYHHRLTANAGDGVKGEGINFTGFVGGTSTSHLYVDPQMPVRLSPSTVQDYDGDANGNTAYAYPAPPCYRALLDHSYLAHQEANNAGAAMMSGQSLSLSLSSHQSNLPLELNLQRYDSSIFSSNEKVSEAGGEGYNLAACSGVSGSGSGTGSASIELTKSTVPLGPFTGYASILKGSRFLKPAQQLLEEICDVGRGILAEINGAGDSGLLEPSPLQSLSENGMIMDESVNCSDGGEQTRNKSRLISMLDEIYRRYKQYYHQMHSAVAAFESVAGLSGAAPFANLAMKAMSKHFRFLKDAIMEQLQLSNKLHGKVNRGRDEDHSHDRSGKGTCGQRAFHAQGFSDPPIWRPQRGLPERAVTVLRAWLFEHFLHPYPTDADKIMLAKQTGLSRNQVSNWFINARVRLWKPMVEEIHTLETRQAQKASHRVQLQEQSPSSHNDHVPSNCSNDPENTASISVPRMGDFNLKRPRNSSDESPKATEELMKLQYDTSLFHNNSHMGAGVGNAGGVSLTLGLHQNGMGLSDAYGPINAARRLGLDSHGEGYMVGGFEVQSRQYGRGGGGGIMGGQLMHDFVG